MAFTEIDSDLAVIIEEGAKRKMEFGADARIKVGITAAVGPVSYYVATKDTVLGTVLKLWCENAENKSRYEFLELQATAQSTAETWVGATGGSKTTMLTFIPVI